LISIDTVRAADPKIYQANMSKFPIAD
jgi:hypothetical protein